MASTYLHNRTQVGDVWDVSAPRGSFVLSVQSSERPVVLLSAGIGITPVLAMLYSLADDTPARQVWWLYGARNSLEHPFWAEVHSLLALLPNARSCVWYSQPGTEDRFGTEFDRLGRLTPEALDALGAPIEADFYLCGLAALALGDVDTACNLSETELAVNAGRYS